MKRILFYLVPVLFCFGIGAMAGWLQSEALVEWYPTLVKSPLTPPAVVFPVAWSILYLCMGISLGAVLAREELLQARSALPGSSSPTCSGCSSPPTSMPTSGPSTKVRRPLCGPRAGIPEKFVSLRPKTRNLWQAPIL